ncbi:MAG: LON peptidase substrate-binding domain-containing protein, partial [Clostridia bacterium]|nr:LON peptidase substrate-binding domain-containing protein [Clostridia bacterium]
MEEQNKKIYPVLVLRGRVMFPQILSLFDVGRKMSLYAVEKSIKDLNGEIFVVTQKDSRDDNPTIDEINFTGVICKIVKMVNVSDKNVRLQLKGIERGVALSVYQDEGKNYYLATVTESPDIIKAPIEEKACYQIAMGKFKDYISANGKFSEGNVETVYGIEDYSEFVNVVAFNLPIKESEKQKILQTVVLADRLEALAKALNDLVESNRIEQMISRRVKKNVEESQKEYYLREQLKAIHEELGDDQSEIESLREKVKAKKIPEEDEEKVFKELDRMSRMSASSPDYAVLRTYVD